ncbi:helix-turn-helix transcriptional regulator [Haloechinothrix sp. LS1_15]|uniref:helix-turn-helix domain-containing protein n=1 Tax=Haloechinothrix sp. LS1_15 TaxID=2652248 RepID=UPI0029454228|nr:helix-turn-helix transcriptional regulator [Haloechinothrix sp. LS1_15]MDV6012448.1 helix-turn-helix domain-containing protein [Haloechinothrix sp. LS1_15]
MSDKPSASRARALAAELRDLRRQAKLSTRDAAERIGVSSASLNRSELGTRMPSPEEVSALLAVYGVTGLAREQALQLARSANPSGWWETGGSALPKQLPTLITFESQATGITEFQPLVVPGLLQTHGYMRAVMEASGVPDADADARVAARAGRQTVLTRKRPPRYLAIIDEAALRRPFGGRAVMAEQLNRIIELAALPNLTVQVIPFDRGGYPIYGPYALLQFAKAPDIVHLEHKQASGFLDQPEDTAPFQPLTDTLKAAALDPAATSEFLAAVAAEYDRK